MKFTGYILTGGKSSRMGEDKAFLKVGEKTFLENAADVLKPNCVEVKAVINKTQNHFIEKLPANVSPVFDIYENRGAIAGIHAAFEDCKTEHAVILAIDLPFVENEFIKNLCEIAAGSKHFSAIIPEQSDKRSQPLCGVYNVEDCLPILKNLLLNEDSLSVNYFLSKLKFKIVPHNQLTANQNLLLNVNTFDEYEKINSGL